MSDKPFEGRVKVSADYVNDSKRMAEFILQSVHRGPGDTVESAMYRAERMFGVPASWLHRLRYRNVADLPTSAFFAILNAYGAACEHSERRYLAERELANARNSKLVGLADSLAGKKAEGPVKEPNSGMETPLKSWRMSAHRRGDEVAEALGVTPAMWSRWENGRRKVPAERVVEIERVTGVSRHQLRPDVFGPANADAA